jgi:hypothetical protein
MCRRDFRCKAPLRYARVPQTEQRHGFTMRSATNRISAQMQNVTTTMTRSPQPHTIAFFSNFRIVPHVAHIREDTRRLPTAMFCRREEDSCRYGSCPKGTEQGTEASLTNIACTDRR